MIVPLHHVEHVTGHILARHEPRVVFAVLGVILCPADVQALALANGMEGQTIVFAEHSLIVEAANLTLSAADNASGIP